MYINQIQLKNFRCFDALTLNFDKKYIILEGMNGSGKTSIIEALHYACYLKSFRTHIPQDMVKLSCDSFFIKIGLHHEQNDHEVKIGFAHKKRIVRLDQQHIASYKDLMNYYRIITITEDDLGLIKDGPDMRRHYIDQVIALDMPEFMTLIKKLKFTVESRNALFRGSCSDDSYLFWSKELFDISKQVQQKRQEMLAQIAVEIKELTHLFFDDQVSITFTYGAKKIAESSGFDSYIHDNPQLRAQEFVMGRSLFGAHLDDFSIELSDKQSRSYASRGQQKLIVLLCKIAQLKIILKKHGVSPLFLLDDFMTDLDPENAQKLINVLSTLDCQLIFSCPVQGSPLQALLDTDQTQIVSIAL